MRCILAGRFVLENAGGSIGRPSMTTHDLIDQYNAQIHPRDDSISSPTTATHRPRRYTTHDFPRSSEPSSLLSAIYPSSFTAYITSNGKSNTHRRISQMSVGKVGFFFCSQAPTLEAYFGHLVGRYLYGHDRHWEETWNSPCERVGLFRFRVTRVAWTILTPAR